MVYWFITFFAFLAIGISFILLYFAVLKLVLWCNNEEDNQERLLP